MKQIALILAILLASATGCEADAPAAKPQSQVQVLDFHATWCGPCKRNAPAIDRMEREGAKIVRIDIDRQPTLAAKYRVNSVPTYVVVVDGKESSRTQDVGKLRKLLRMLRVLRNIERKLNEQSFTSPGRPNIPPDEMPINGPVWYPRS